MSKSWLALPLALIVLLLLLPRNAGAWYYYPPVYYQTVVVEKIVEKPIIAPVSTVLVPSHAFQYIPSVQAAVSPRPSPATRPAPQAAPPVDDWPAAPTTALGAGGNLAAVFQAHGCIKCHGAGGKSTPLFDAAGQLLASVNRQAILDQVEQDLMPPKARQDPSQAVPVEHKNLLRAYLAR